MAKRVLITDDTQFMRMTLKNILTRSGYEVVAEACSGQEAVELYAQFRPDFVLMDLVMPGMNGITALQAIRRVDPNARVVMCMTAGQQSLLRDALEAGAADSISKPFQSQVVVEGLQKMFG